MKLFGAILSIQSFLFILVICSLPSNIYSAEPDINCFFIENKGQWNDDVLFLAKISSMNAWITEKSIVYDFYKTEYSETEEKEKFPFDRDYMQERMENSRRIGHVVRMKYQPAEIFFENGMLRYDYIIAPGADPGQIALSFKGASGIAVNENGKLSINTSDLSTGMYFVILQTPTIRKAVKMEVVR